jgi:uracil phosphoribosyltransferase
MIHVVEHPLLKVHLTRLRDRHTPPDTFRRHLTALTRLLAYPVLAAVDVDAVPVETPLTATTGYRLANPPVLVPVLRAGLGMVEGFLDVVPDAVVSHLGLYRDHRTLKPVRYYANFPRGLAGRPVLLLDPMLATGGSASDAIDFLKEQGVLDIRLVNIIAAPEGAERIARDHPEVPVFAAQMDERLNDQAYILPGLGDAGDRQFGTVP